MPVPDLSASPTPPEPDLQVAARLLAEGRPDAAADRLAALLATAPTYAAAHVLHATALEAAGQVAAALDAWDHAAFLVPTSPLVRRERQRLLVAGPPEAGPEAAPEAGPEAAPEAPEADTTASGPGSPDVTAPEPLAEGEAAAEGEGAEPSGHLDPLTDEQVDIGPEDARPTEENVAEEAGTEDEPGLASETRLSSHSPELDDDPGIRTVPLDEFAFLDVEDDGEPFDFSAFESPAESVPDGEEHADAEPWAGQETTEEPPPFPQGRVMDLSEFVTGIVDEESPVHATAAPPDVAPPEESDSKREETGADPSAPGPFADEGPTPRSSDPLMADLRAAGPESTDGPGGHGGGTFESVAESETFAAPGPDPSVHRGPEPPSGDAPPVADWGDLPAAEVDVLPPEPSAPPAGPASTVDEEGVGWTVLSEGAVPESPTWTDAVLGSEGDGGPSETPPQVDVPVSSTTEGASDAEGTFPVSDELDDLIAQLEGARIMPDPAFEGPAVTFEEGNVDDLVSETLAKIYAAQHQYVEAAVIYEKLAAQRPEQADEMLQRAAELRQRR